MSGISAKKLSVHLQNQEKNPFLFRAGSFTDVQCVPLSQFLQMALMLISDSSEADRKSQFFFFFFLVRKMM